MYKIYTWKLGMPYRQYQKILLVMRLTTVILIVTLMQVSAAGLAQKVTLSKSNAQLETVLSELRRQTGFHFIYTDLQLSKSKPVTILVNQVMLQDVLDEVFKDQPLSYSIVSKTVIIKEKDKSFLDRFIDRITAIEVNGVVRSNTGNLLSGAIVKVKGSPFGLLTNANGEFKINSIEEGKILVVSFIGYKTQEVAAISAMLIILEPQIDELDEVAVISTGYQELNKERATGSYAKPDMEVFKNRTGTTNIITRLEGLIPGLAIVPGPRITTGSRNGSTAPNQSIIRGVSSIQLNPDPLFVVNNVMVDNITAINPDDVASITVLKDAAATAIWGARAANGVIVITTKTGRGSKKLKISYNSYVNFQGKPDFNYRPVLSSSDFIKAAREIFSASDYPLNTLTYSYIAPHESIQYNLANLPQSRVNARLDSLAGIQNLSQISNLFYRNAVSSNQTISASAGNEYYSMYSSISYNKNTSNRPGEKNDVYRINLSQELNPLKRIKILLNTTLSDSRSSSVPNLNIDNQFLPYQLFMDANGRSIAMPYMTGWSDALRKDYEGRSRLNLNYVPAEEYKFGNSKNKSIDINLNANVNVDIWKGISFRGTYGYINSPTTGNSYNDIGSYGSRKELLGATVSPTATSVPVYYLPTSGGKYSAYNNDQQNWTVRNQLSYQRTLRGGKDMLSLSGGQDIQEQLSNNNSTTVYGYNEALQTSQLPDYTTLNRGINAIIYGTRVLSPVANPAENLQRFLSWFGLASYSFASKYNVDASWRVDHSNLFGQDKSTQNKPVWSVGGKWLVAKEDFMKDIKWLNELSIRATYGIAGNSPYSAAGSNYNILTADFGNNIAGASLGVTTPANNRLLWEITKTKNLGLDVAVLKNRLAISMDIYDKRTTDLLGGYTLNPLTGYNSITGNIGELTNNGVDIHIRSINLQLRDFQWSSNLVVSYNRNKLVNYGVASPFLSNPVNKISASYFADYSLLPLFAYRYAGLNNLGDPMITLQDGTVTAGPFDAKSDDVVYQGTVMPVFSGGFSNTFTFKGMSLSANMIFNMGHVMRRDLNTFYTGRLTGSAGNFTGNINPEFNNRWRNPGDEAFTNIPSYVANEDVSYERRETSYYRNGDANVTDAGYIKLRDVTLSYALPRRVLDFVKVASASLYVQGTNFMVWKANKYGIDPEFHNLASGTRNLPPFKHSFSIGTNITF